MAKAVILPIVAISVFISHFWGADWAVPEAMAVSSRALRYLPAAAASPHDSTDWQRTRSTGDVPPAGFFRSQSVAPAAPIAPSTLPRRMITDVVYVGCYSAAATIGTRQGIGADFKIIRLESAYGYDFVSHIYVANQIGRILTSFNRWAGRPERESRKRGAWWGAFGMMTFMEIFNGFVPEVRLDPLDIPANALGAWLADGYLDVVEKHPRLEHFSLQFGWKSIDRLVSGDHSAHLLGAAWHDYENGRFGLGYRVGPAHRPFITIFATYSISSMNIAQLKNRFGAGVELPVVAWSAPLIRTLPGGNTFVRLYSWLDDRFLMPLFYIQLFEIDTPAWSEREPFTE
jgi:hypothetical protein